MEKGPNREEQRAAGRKAEELLVAGPVQLFARCFVLFFPQPVEEKPTESCRLEQCEPRERTQSLGLSSFSLRRDVCYSYARVGNCQREPAKGDVEIQRGEKNGANATARTACAV